jgi:hypothetical protein
MIKAAVAMTRMTAAVIIIAALILAGGAMATSYILTHRPKPSFTDQLTANIQQEIVACLQGGGTWYGPGQGVLSGPPHCEHGATQP